MAQSCQTSRPQSISSHSTSSYVSYMQPQSAQARSSVMVRLRSLRVVFVGISPVAAHAVVNVRRGFQLPYLAHIWS